MKDVTWEMIVAAFVIVITIGIIMALDPLEEVFVVDYNYHYTLPIGDFR